MKTKSEIVQRLLDEKRIDAEEAVILLQSESRDLYVYPIQPFSPDYAGVPRYLLESKSNLSNTSNILLN